MISYYEYAGRNSATGEADVQLDVIEFEPEGVIEVSERTFATRGELLAHMAREAGRTL